MKRKAGKRSHSWVAVAFALIVAMPALGPGSPTLRLAGEWPSEQPTRRGLAAAVLEPSGTTSRGRSVDGLPKPRVVIK